MTRRYGPAQLWVERFLVSRQIAEGGDGKTCEWCHKQQDEKGRTRLFIGHRDDDEDNNDPANVYLTHQSCNIRKTPPKVPQDVPPKREPEGGVAMPTFIHGSQSEISKVMVARWSMWTNDTNGEFDWPARSGSGTEKGGPFKHFEVISLKALTKWAPRALARTSLGEERLGVPQSYEDYVEMDSTEFGGPLHIFSPTTGDLKGLLCVEYVKPEPKIAIIPDISNKP